MKRRTLRGRLEDNFVHRLIVDDGRTNHGYIVKEFYVWPSGVSDDGVFATLGTQYDMIGGANAGDNRQIAWAGSAWGTGGSTQAGAFNVVDPDHVVITDLWIRRENAADECNYLVILEPITLSEDEAIMALIKERSQDDIR